MDLIGIGAAATAVKSVVSMFFPDKTEEEKARITMMLTAMQGQLDANKEEAKSPSLFVAGWRPGVGWVCVASLAMIYIPKALFLSGMWIYQAYVVVAAWHGVGAAPVLPVYPDLGVADLIGLLGSLLGIGGLRSFDKRNGTDTKVIAPKAERPGTPD